MNSPIMLKIIAATCLAVSLSACGSLNGKPANALVPAVAVAANGAVLSDEQIRQLKKSVAKQLNSPQGNSPAVGNKAFTQTDRLTLSPKLPAGAVTQHLKTTLLLRTDGKSCFLTQIEQALVTPLKGFHCKVK